MARTRTSDGYVTLAVLVMSALLAGLVSSILLVSRPALDLARIGADDMVLEALFDGGLEAAAYRLYAAEELPYDVDGTALQFKAGSVGLAVLDESGRVDLNHSPPELLEGLFTAVGGRSMEAATFAARVVDWRDEDSDQSVGGAEANDYAAAQAPYGPSNRPFASVGELGKLLGLTREDLALLAPHLTIYNLTGTIEPFSATAPVLRAVPDLAAPEEKRLLAAQEAGAEGREAALSIVEAHPDFLHADPSGVYRVTLQVRLNAGRLAAGEAILTAPRSDQPAAYGVVAWADLPPPAEAR